MESYVVNLRRELHMHAEIGFDLEQTLAILRRGVAVSEGVSDNVA